MQEGRLVNESSEYDRFKMSIDSWIKKFNRDVSILRQYPKIIEQNVENIEHNYELTREVMRDVDNLKQEIKMLRIVQIAMLQNRIK